MNIVNRKQKSVNVYYLKHSRFPRFYIPAIRRNGNAHGIILFHWLFIGIERIKRLSGDEVSIVWNWGLRPIRYESKSPRRTTTRPTRHDKHDEADGDQMLL